MQENEMPAHRNRKTERTKTITHRNANLLLENLSSESNLFETHVWRLLRLVLLFVVGRLSLCLFVHLDKCFIAVCFHPTISFISKCIFYKHTHTTNGNRRVNLMHDRYRLKFLFVLILWLCIILISFGAGLQLALIIIRLCNWLRGNWAASIVSYQMEH